MGSLLGAPMRPILILVPHFHWLAGVRLRMMAGKRPAASGRSRSTESLMPSRIADIFYKHFASLRLLF